MKKIGIIITLSFLSLLLIRPALAQEPPSCSDYTIQAGDTLAGIAEKYYNDRTAYRSIVEATNLKAETNTSYTKIADPSSIEPGWKICLPDIDGLSPQMSSEQPAIPAAPVAPPENAENQTGEESQPEMQATPPASINLSEEIPFDAQSLANEVTRVSASAQPYDNSSPPGPTGDPGHVAFLFDGEERLRIYPVEAYEDMWNVEGDKAISQNITQLRTILAKRPEAPQNPLPALPPMAGYNDLAAQVIFLDFANGSGISFIGRFSQDASPVFNSQLKYFFQGLTHDNQYYVSFEYPISTSALPEELTPEQEAQIETNFYNYLQGVQETLNSLETDKFTPDLTQLDALIQSLFAPDIAAD